MFIGDGYDEPHREAWNGGGPALLTVHASPSLSSSSSSSSSIPNASSSTSSFSSSAEADALLMLVCDVAAGRGAALSSGGSGRGVLVLDVFDDERAAAGGVGAGDTILGVSTASNGGVVVVVKNMHALDRVLRRHRHAHCVQKSSSSSSSSSSSRRQRVIASAPDIVLQIRRSNGEKFIANI
jgi:hypothetical protein